MHTFTEHKADCETPRAGIRIVVGDRGLAGGVGEAGEDGGGGGVEVGGCGEGGRGYRGGKGAGEEDAAGVDCGVVSCGVCGKMGGGPGRKPGWGPAMVRSSKTRSPLSLFISGEEERGIVDAGLWV